MNIRNMFVLGFVSLLLFQFSCAQPDGNIADTDSSFVQQLSGYYDLRERSTFFQITNTSEFPITLHVQIFQHDRECDELDFFDTLTPHDTVIYDLDNMTKNDGSQVPINLNDNSYGYVVVSIPFGDFPIPGRLIGNFRIIDDSGYEYRTNLASFGFFPFPLIQEAVEFQNNLFAGLDDDDDDEVLLNTDGPQSLYANFNTVDGANLADLVGYAYFINTDLQSYFIPAGVEFGTVFNYDPGVEFDIFVFDMNEDPLSCDSRVFACGGIMNYGINEDYRASRGEDLVCPGGGLADPNGGFISFENGRFINYITPEFPDPCADAACDDTNPPNFTSVPFQAPIFVGLIGINNGNGTGSMDYWYSNQLIDFPGDDDDDVVMDDDDGG